MIVTGAARIDRRQDGAEAIAARSIGKEVSAIPKAGIVVFAAFIGVPQLDEGSLDGPARARQHLTVDLNQLPFAVRLDKIGALRRTWFEIWPFRLSHSRFLAIMALRRRNCALRENQVGIPDREPQAACGESGSQNLAP